MKYLITILVLFFAFTLKAQSPFPRSSSTVTAVDSHLRAGLSFGLSIQTDTVMNGLDSLGSLIYIKSGDNQGVWYRDSNYVGGGHIWVKFAAMSDDIMTLTTDQTATGRKTFDAPITFNDSAYFNGFIYSNPTDVSKSNSFFRSGDLVDFTSVANNFNVRADNVNWDSLNVLGSVLPSSVLSTQYIGIDAVDTLYTFGQFLNGGSSFIAFNTYFRSGSGDTMSVTSNIPKDNIDFYRRSVRAASVGLYLARNDDFIADTVTKWMINVPHVGLATEAKVTKRGYLTSFSDLLLGNTSVSDTANNPVSTTFKIGERIAVNILDLKDDENINDTTYAIYQRGVDDSVILKSSRIRTANIPAGVAAFLIGIDDNGNWVLRDTTGGGGGSYTFTSPLSNAGSVVSIANAVANGSTKGAASFATNDFNSTSGNISIDYTNGQSATTSLKGFLTNTDWNTFNNKQATITGGASTITTSNLTASRALVSNGSGKVDVSTTTSTELGYLSGVTANLAFIILQYTTQALTDAATITMNCNSGFRGIVTLGGNRTLAFSNFPTKGDIQIKVIQDGTGGRTLTLPANSKVPIGFGSGTTINLSTAAGDYDILYCYFDGTYYNWTIAKNFQ